jgi:hypothetical protein
MLAMTLIYGAAAAAGFLLWYLWFARRNRQRAAQALRWVEAAFAGHGHIAGLQWLSPSHLKVRLRLAPSLFRDPAVTVRLSPRELPLNWLLAWLRKRPETLTFEADLDASPTYNLEVHNHRWCGRTRKNLSPHAEDWVVEQTGPFVITTRSEWQQDITSMLHALVASRERDFLSVSFQSASPNFRATAPLRAISPGSQPEGEIFDVLRELALGAETSRF